MTLQKTLQREKILLEKIQRFEYEDSENDFFDLKDLKSKLNRHANKSGVEIEYEILKDKFKDLCAAMETKNKTVTDLQKQISQNNTNLKNK